ncbi:hypothetical protein GCM10023321_72060 [Pseudonocardia eucalypti]|uniref:Ribbon-helix-helix CopG family protein n=1 Tax=Pseudonocardia eucalypti TaxID=648755 RepID=A0ABP9R6K9_9PSEU|nr:putative transcriptional regulator [Pseudonocardia eucalypti]
MAMTLRLTDDEATALRAQADSEGRSMQDVAREAVREYVSRRAHEARVHKAVQHVMANHAEVLRRLGEA